MVPPARLEELSTLDWLREALEVSPDAFAIHHLVRDDAGCFRALEAAEGTRPFTEEPRLPARGLASRLLDTIGQGAAAFSLVDQRIHASNHAFARLLDLPPEQLLGTPVGSLFGNDAVRMRLESWLADLNAPHTRVEPLRLQLSDERVITMEALRVHHTHFVLLLARDEGTPSLAPVDPSLRAELLGATDAVAMVDIEGTIVFGSPGLHHLFGYERGELTGLSVDTLVPEASRAGHAASRARLFESGDRTLQGEGFTARRKDGTPLPIGMSLSRLTVNNRPLALCFITDLERRREATDRLRDYQEHLRRMSFDAAVAAEQERRKVAVELHDCLGQALALAKLKLSALEGTVSDAARASVSDVIELIDQCAADTRTLTFQLSPPVLYDLGLPAALDWLKDDLHLRCGLKVAVTDEASPFKLDETSAGVTFRAVRELLVNVVKHAKTTSAFVTLEKSATSLSIVVADEGSGFEPLARQALSGRRFGLASIRDQLNRIGGSFEVRSSPGQGTALELLVPLAQDHDPTSSPATH